MRAMYLVPLRLDVWKIEFVDDRIRTGTTIQNYSPARNRRPT